MSRKLATTIKDSAIPGKYKRVLEAYAAFANNDGTNIYPVQEKLGLKAGCSVDTIGRQTKELLVTAVLRRAEKHTCKIKGCSGGSTHYCGYNGKWTNVYEIQLGNLQNAVNHLTAICGKARAAKCRKPSAAICGTDSGIKETPATLGKNPDSSSAHAAVSEIASEGEAASLRSSAILSDLKADVVQSQTEPSLPKTSQNQKQITHWHTPELSSIWLARTGKPFTADEHILATDLIAEHGYRVVEAVLDITLNRREKSAKMVWRRFKVFADNWQTNYDLSMAWFVFNRAKKNYPREIPPKFPPMTVKREEALKASEKESRAYFARYCKNGEWSLAPEEWKALGAEGEHFLTALEFCCENGRRVTKQEFIDLIRETMGVPIAKDEPTGGGFADLCPECGWENTPDNFRCICPGKAKAVTAGTGFQHEEAE